MGGAMVPLCAGECPGLRVYAMPLCLCKLSLVSTCLVIKPEFSNSYCVLWAPTVCSGTLLRLYFLLF